MAAVTLCRAAAAFLSYILNLIILIFELNIVPLKTSIKSTFARKSKRKTSNSFAFRSLNRTFVAQIR